jgi:ABC-type sugar transport system ATPase subunit
MSPPIVQFRSISKSFAGIRALTDISLDIHPGETLGLMGENGAGKSTLGKILAGVHPPDSGSLLIAGHERHLRSPADALRAGVGMVHQELAFCPDLTVAENLCMSAYPRRFGPFVDRTAMRQRARELLAHIGINLDVTQLNRHLTTAQEQLCQIAAAVGTGARIIVFDEPTSSLSEPEARSLFQLIADLKSRGVTLVYVSHRMREITLLCDRVAVLRDGRHVGTLPRSDITEDAVVRLMVGRSVTAHIPAHLSKPPGELRLRATHISSPGHCSNVSLEVRAGEIVGLAGLVGAGRSEVATALFGLDPHATGHVEIDGHPLPLRSVRLAKRRGLALLPEDRKKQGLVLGMSCTRNISLASLSRISRSGFLRFSRERNLSHNFFSQLNIKAPSPSAPASSLSGGNQQKVALAKWLARDRDANDRPGQLKVLIVDEPTRGVDVAAKANIHALLDHLAQQGLAILLISSELPELLALSTRILVMREGKLVAELPRSQATEETVLRHMAGV